MLNYSHHRTRDSRSLLFLTRWASGWSHSARKLSCTRCKQHTTSSSGMEVLPIRPFDRSSELISPTLRKLQWSGVLWPSHAQNRPELVPG